MSSAKRPPQQRLDAIFITINKNIIKISLMNKLNKIGQEGTNIYND